MSSTASPSFLPPPPNRAPGVRRLNSIPLVIVFLIACVFIGGVVYTAIDRANKSKIEAAKEEDAKKVEGGKPPNWLHSQQAHGEVQATMDRQASRDNPTPPPPPAQTSQQTMPATTSGSDITEQARAQAWQNYYAQVAQIQQHKLQMDQQALWGGAGNDAGQSAGQGAGGVGGLGAPQQPGQPDMPPGQSQMAAGSVVGGFSTGGTDPNGQMGKQAFLRTPGDIAGAQEDLGGGTHGPKPDTIMEGTPIPARLVDAATSDSPGQLVAEVSTNVCDDMTGQHLLIPQGTRVITTYDTAVSAGQDRMGTIAQRLVFPDTSSRQLGSMQIADQSGMAGLKDQVNTHFWEKFWATATIAIAGAGAQLAQPQASSYGGYYNPSGVATGQVTQGFSQLGQAYAQRGLSIPNTIELRRGLQLTIKPNKDIKLNQYIDARGYGKHMGACS